MHSNELLQSWQRTERLLREARALLSQDAALKFADDLVQFDEFIEHNELGLAHDYLRSIASEAGQEPPHLNELLALAAASMRRPVDPQP